MAFVIILKKYYFKIIIKNNEMLHLSTFAFKKYGKFAHNLEKLCPRSLALALTIPDLGLERVCPRKIGPWPWIFF